MSLVGDGTAAPSADAGDAAFHGYRERRLAGLFSEVLGVEVTRADTDFFALGGDDEAAARLLDLVEEDAGVRFPPGTVAECPTVRLLATRLARSKTTRRARVVGWGEELPGPPLFCLISTWQARAIALHFNAIARRPFYAVQPAGFEGRSRVDRTIEKRARRALADIRAVQPTGPYHIAGYSLSVYVAFEVARMLAADGEQADVLVMIDMWAPVFSKAFRRRLRVEQRWLDVCARRPERGRFFDVNRRARFVRVNLHDSRERLAWRVRGWTAGVIPRRVKVQGTLFHELGTTSSRSYRPKPFDVDMIVIRAQAFGGWDWEQRRTERDLSWSRVSSGRIEVMDVDGTHLTILEAETASELAAVLARAVGVGRGAAGDEVVDLRERGLQPLPTRRGRSAATR